MILDIGSCTALSEGPPGRSLWEPGAVSDLMGEAVKEDSPRESGLGAEVGLQSLLACSPPLPVLQRQDSACIEPHSWQKLPATLAILSGATCTPTIHLLICSFFFLRFY